MFPFLTYFLNKKNKEAYLDPFVDGELDEADGGVVGHGVQVVLPPPVHARRYEPAAIKTALVNQSSNKISLNKLFTTLYNN
jgi:hypothetical protein